MDHTPAPAAGGRHRADPGAVDATPRPAAAAAATATATAAGRCPSCASRVGPREEWCSLCHAALRPDAAPSPASAAAPPVPAVEVAAVEVSAAEVAAAEVAALQLPAAETPAPAPHAPDAAAPELDPEVVEGMLAQLAGAAARPGLRGLPSTQARVLVAALGGLGLTGLLLLAMTAAGAVLG